jgi:hypothetical protein
MKNPSDIRLFYNEHNPPTKTKSGVCYSHQAHFHPVWTVEDAEKAIKVLKIWIEQRTPSKS